MRAVILITVLFAVSCSEGTKVTAPAPPRYEMTEPKYVLANVEAAFNNKDISLLAATLSEDFTFYFHPNDIGRDLANGYTIPASWTRAEFLRAVGNLFAEAAAVSLANSWGTISSPPAGVGEYSATAAVTFIVMVDENNGYTINGPCRYDFVKRAPSAWLLVAWRDDTYECGGCFGGESMGQVLAAYY